jgi:hypothetical protein
LIEILNETQATFHGPRATDSGPEPAAQPPETGLCRCENCDLQQFDLNHFPWAEARKMIDGWRGGINIAHEALDRHVAQGHGDQVALRWLGKDGTTTDLSYARMAELAARFANVLSDHGLTKGDSVFALMGRVPELYATALGTLEGGAGLHAAVLRLRAGADPHPDGDRRAPMSL